MEYKNMSDENIKFTKKTIKPDRVLVVVEVEPKTGAVRISSDPVSMPPELVGRTLLNAASSMIKPTALFDENKDYADVVMDFNNHFMGINRRWEGMSKYKKGVRNKKIYD